MGKAIYACNKRKKTFTRKYNAERHNTDIYNEMAVIYNKENNWVSIKRKIDNVAASTVGATPVSTTAAEKNTENKYNKTSKKNYKIQTPPLKILPITVKTIQVPIQMWINSLNSLKN